MVKRSKLNIIKDILQIIIHNHNEIKPTPLLRKSNLSSKRFKEYYIELINKGFIVEVVKNKNKTISITEKGIKFIEKYKSIVSFIEEFDL